MPIVGKRINSKRDSLLLLLQVVESSKNSELRSFKYYLGKGATTESTPASIQIIQTWGMIFFSIHFFQFLFGILFPLFSLDFYFPFLYGHQSWSHFGFIPIFLLTRQHTLRNACKALSSRRACGHVDVGTCPHQGLAVTLTLSQPGGTGGGANYAHPILVSTPEYNRWSTS